MKKIDEKTKTMAVAALGVGLLGIGAFQFIGGSKGPANAAVAKPKADASQVASAPPAILNPDYANPLANRDPFSVPADMAPTPPPAAKSPTVQNRGSRPESVIKPLGGKIAPLLPPVGGQPGQSGLASVPLKAPDPVFSYALCGVVQGARPAALFSDSGGNQRLIPLGSALDGDSQLTAVGDHGVVVRFHGKDLHLSLGKDPSGK